jgi:predicted RNA-binding Zn-ribbon protein involved in translation (DUF1610 family)
MLRVERRKIHRNRILRCPMCGSTQVELAAGQITGQVYHCRDCQYVGSLILEVDVADDGTPLP